MWEIKILSPLECYITLSNIYITKKFGIFTKNFNKYEFLILLQYALSAYEVGVELGNW